MLLINSLLHCDKHHKLHDISAKSYNLLLYRHYFLSLNQHYDDIGQDLVSIGSS
jgi:hypothetical protein